MFALRRYVLSLNSEPPAHHHNPQVNLGLGHATAVNIKPSDLLKLFMVPDKWMAQLHHPNRWRARSGARSSVDCSPHRLLAMMS